MITHIRFFVFSVFAILFLLGVLSVFCFLLFFDFYCSIKVAVLAFGLSLLLPPQF